MQTSKSGNMASQPRAAQPTRRLPCLRPLAPFHAAEKTSHRPASAASAKVAISGCLLSAPASTVAAIPGQSSREPRLLFSSLISLPVLRDRKELEGPIAPSSHPRVDDASRPAKWPSAGFDDLRRPATPASAVPSRAADGVVELAPARPHMSGAAPSHQAPSGI
ncbi:hypothetical protein B0T11DRAFT_288327 [Plectosphaerella cucumerina]|uniref:Uncharacterized protein n=1 Tax=Plectosphaerella cucumerina TaxID=40658 RepID=A0A8K0T9A4_9PEZI|nr:hypothetical protein B0T11DRAFT_288327 [Plectosphaerella cucumerina]